MKFGHSFRIDHANENNTPRGRPAVAGFDLIFSVPPSTIDRISPSLSPPLPSFSRFLSRLSMKPISLSSRTVAVLSPPFWLPIDSNTAVKARKNIGFQ